MMSIEHQKKVADYVLERLEIADPYCVLAGGAPRDWYFGNVANDLDIYYYTSAETMSASSQQLERLFPGSKVEALREVAKRDDNLYSTMPFLRRIWNSEIDGVKVQFIQLNSNGKQFKVVEYMDVSICQIWYKDGKTNTTKNFDLGEKLKCMWTLNDCKWSDKHPAKMRERFPDYLLVNEMQLMNMMTRKLLED